MREFVRVQRNSKCSVESDNRLCLVIVWENTHTQHSKCSVESDSRLCLVIVWENTLTQHQPSHTSDQKTGIIVAVLPDTWCYGISTGIGWPGVSVLWLNGIAHLICTFCLNMTESKVVRADLLLSEQMQLRTENSDRKQPWNQTRMETITTEVKNLQVVCTWVHLLQLSGLVVGNKWLAVIGDLSSFCHGCAFCFMTGNSGELQILSAKALLHPSTMLKRTNRARNSLW